MEEPDPEVRLSSNGGYPICDVFRTLCLAPDDEMRQLLDAAPAVAGLDQQAAREFVRVGEGPSEVTLDVADHLLKLLLPPLPCGTDSAQLRAGLGRLIQSR